MKLIISNGRELTVWNITEILGKWLAPSRRMVPFHGSRVVEDDEAREIVRASLAAGCVRASEP